MRKIIIILIFNIKALLILSQVQCQPKNLLSPNAASLGEYGVVPVSPYTGKQNISIPLYDISIGNHNIPITLSYYAGGVRVEQLPGWTGMGWTLNAGGCISRIVNDNSDEFYALLSDTNSREIMGYFYHSEYFNHKQLVSGNENSIWLENAKNAIRDYWDIAPDKFQFNFLGYSGVFYWTPENKWKILCDKPIKVEFDYENGFTDTYSKTSEKFNLEWTNRKEPRSVQFKTFTIIGEDGTKYVFGGNDDAIEFSIGLFNQHEGHMTANHLDNFRSLKIGSGDLKIIIEQAKKNKKIHHVSGKGIYKRIIEEK